VKNLYNRFKQVDSKFVDDERAYAYGSLGTPIGK
jgi:hypothetical protein